MTGIYVRVQADDGKWENLELDALTDAELDRFVAMKKGDVGDDGWNWVRALARWIRDNVREGGQP